MIPRLSICARAARNVCTTLHEIWTRTARACCTYIAIGRCVPVVPGESAVLLVQLAKQTLQANPPPVAASAAGTSPPSVRLTCLLGLLMLPRFVILFVIQRDDGEVLVGFKTKLDSMLRHIGTRGQALEVREERHGVADGHALEGLQVFHLHQFFVLISFYFLVVWVYVEA